MRPWHFFPHSGWRLFTRVVCRKATEGRLKRTSPNISSEENLESTLSGFDFDELAGQ